MFGSDAIRDAVKSGFRRELNWSLCLMLRIGSARNGARRADREHFRRQSAADRAESAQALFRRHRDQPDGGAETGADVSRGWLGPDAPDGIARIGLADLLRLWRRRAPLIWHARRNNEMIVGVLLRALGWPLKLVFTSAAQRHHTWITRWLIRRMDAIIATIEISASFLKREATVIMHGVDTDAMRRRPIARPRSRKPDCRAATRSAASAGCARKRAPTFSWMRCAGCCRAIPISPRSSSARSRRSSTLSPNDLKKRIEAAGLQSRIVITGECRSKTCSAGISG